MRRPILLHLRAEEVSGISLAVSVSEKVIALWYIMYLFVMLIRNLLVLEEWRWLRPYCSACLNTLSPSAVDAWNELGYHWHSQPHSGSSPLKKKTGPWSVIVTVVEISLSDVLECEVANESHPELIFGLLVSWNDLAEEMKFASVI